MKNKAKMTRKNFTLPHMVVERVEAASAATGFSQSHLTHMALLAFLEKFEQEQRVPDKAA